MRNFIASIKAIIIIIIAFNYNCVCSSPTHNQQPETELDEASSSSEESSRCLELVPTSDNEIIPNMNFAVDSEGKVCIVRFDSSRFRSFVNNSDEIDAKFTNVTRDFCPTWPQSKKCLVDHLNSNRCNEDDRTKAMDIRALNQDIVFAELFCTPIKKDKFLNLLKNTMKERLWDCLDSEEARTLFLECFDKKMLEKGYSIRYQDLARIYNCANPGLRNCAKGDPAREVKLIQLWKELDRQFAEAHRDFWN